MLSSNVLTKLTSNLSWQKWRS